MDFTADYPTDSDRDDADLADYWQHRDANDAFWGAQRAQMERDLAADAGWIADQEACRLADLALVAARFAEAA